MNTSSVLIECDYGNNIRICSSGILFSKNYVLTTCNIFIPFIQKHELQRGFPSGNQKGLNFDVATFSQPTIKIVNFKSPPDVVQKRIARIAAAFFCENIRDAVKTYLKNWSVNFKTSNTDVKGVLPLFFILKIWNNTDTRANNYELLDAVKNFMTTAAALKYSKADSVFIEGTPYGMSDFLNSYSQGIISNIAGKNSCFILTDCPTSIGCEGSPVFLFPENRFQESCPIAIVISCLNWFEGSSVGLTIAANLAPLLSQAVFPNNEINPEVYPLKETDERKRLLRTIEKSVVKIISKNSYGTAILLNKENGIFLTASHVIESSGGEVYLYWHQVKIKAKVLYQTPKNGMFDLAIVRCDKNKCSMLNNIQVATDVARRGEEVFAVGFSFCENDISANTVISKGYVSKVGKSMVQTTCNIFDGFSGGPILRKNGELVAVILSSTKSTVTDEFFPRINLCVPVSVFYHIIEKFLNTDSKEIGILNRLHCEDELLCSPWEMLLHSKL